MDKPVVRRRRRRKTDWTGLPTPTTSVETTPTMGIGSKPTHITSTPSSLIEIDPFPSDSNSRSDGRRSSVSARLPEPSPISSISGSEDSLYLSEDDDGLESELAMVGLRQLYTDITMRQFYRVFNKAITLLGHFKMTPGQQHQGGNNRPGEADSTQSRRGQAGPPRSDMGDSRDRGKRKRRGSNNDEDDDDVDERERDRKRQQNQPGPGPESEPKPLFACVFYKKDPVKYHRDGNCACKGPGFPTIHRLKEHLFRYHKKPIHCPRCRITFRFNSDKDTHLLQEPCEIRLTPTLDGLNEDQVKLLRVRKRKKDGRTEEDLWREAYRIIFPEVLPESVPSPYHEALSRAAFQRATIRTYTDYLQDELPSRVSAHIIQRLGGSRYHLTFPQELASSSDIDNTIHISSQHRQLMSDLPTIIQTALSETSQLYRQTIGEEVGQHSAVHGMSLLSTQTTTDVAEPSHINEAIQNPEIGLSHMVVPQTIAEDEELMRRILADAFEDLTPGQYPPLEPVFFMEARESMTQIEGARPLS